VHTISATVVSFDFANISVLQNSHIPFSSAALTVGVCARVKCVCNARSLANSRLQSGTAHMKLPENRNELEKTFPRPLSFRFCVEASYCNEDSLLAVNDGGGVGTCATGITSDLGGTATVADELAILPETEKLILQKFQQKQPDYF
jgi:hypothetical protein